MICMLSKELFWIIGLIKFNAGKFKCDKGYLFSNAAKVMLFTYDV